MTLPPARRRHDRDRDHPAGTAAGLRRPRRASRRRALQAALRHDRDDPAVRRRGARARPPPRPAGQGLGHRDDLHVRRRDRRGVVARARPARPRGHRHATAACSPRLRPPSSFTRGRRARPTPSSPARPCSAPRPRVVELLRESGDLIGDPKPIDAPGQVLREGRQAARDRLDPPVVHHQRRARRGAAREAARCRAGDRLPPRLHARALRELGRRPHRRLADLAAALLRRADPGLVPARRRRRAAARAADRARRGPAAGRPVVGIRRPATTRPSAAQPDGFVGELDIMDTWATSSLTPQIAGGWARRRRAVRPGVPVLAALAGAGHHPHLAVLDGAARAARARQHPVEARRDLGLHRRPRPQEDVEVEGQRRHAGRRCSTSTGRMPCATGRRRRRLGTDAAFDPQNPKQIKIGRRLAIKVLNAAKFVYGFEPAEDRTAAHLDVLPVIPSSTPTCSPSSASWSTPRPRRTRSTTTPARSR